MFLAKQQEKHVLKGKSVVQHKCKQIATSHKCQDKAKTHFVLPVHNKTNGTEDLALHKEPVFSVLSTTQIGAIENIV